MLEIIVSTRRMLKLRVTAERMPKIIVSAFCFIGGRTGTDVA